MNTQIKISAVVCTYEEEKNIAACLESIKWADEIIIVDDGSTDKTVQIASKFTKNIYKHKSAGYVEPARNFALSKATGKWVLLVDADEEIPTTLARKLQEIAKSDTKINCFFIPRVNVIFTKWIEHTGWWPDYQARFFRNGKVIWSPQIHSVPKIIGEAAELKAVESYAILHQNYPSISQFLRKIDSYSGVEARELIQNGYQFNWIDVMRKPLDEFLSRFFARAGYRDGLHGLILSLFQAMSLFVTYVKVWEQEGFKEVDNTDFLEQTQREWKKETRDLKHWFYQEKIQSIKNPRKKTIYRILKKINLK